MDTAKIHTFCDRTHTRVIVAAPEPSQYFANYAGMPLVIDNGAFGVRAGWASDKDPRCTTA